MAEPTARRRSPAARSPKGPQGPLGQKARRLQDLAAQLRDQHTTVRHLEELQVRRDELRKIASELSATAGTARLLRADLGSLLALPDVGAALEEVRTLEARDWEHLEAASDRLPAAIRKPIVALESALREVWKSSASADVRAAPLVQLLARLNGHASARNRIQTLLAQLATEASRLPSTQEALERVRELQRVLSVEIDALEKRGLDEEVMRFFQEAMTGASLAKLLENASLLEQLRKCKMLEYFTIVLKPPAKPNT